MIPFEQLPLNFVFMTTGRQKVKERITTEDRDIDDTNETNEKKKNEDITDKNLEERE